MSGEMFEPTVPFGEPQLLRASAFRRYLEELEAEPTQGGISTRISSLSPSLRADLMRFEQHGGSTEVVEVLAACVRHSKRVTIHLQCDQRVVPLTVFPQERLVHCPMDMHEMIEKHLPRLRVMHVEPALLRPPGDMETALIGEGHLHHPLAPLLWELALRGLRGELLPEIAGAAVYRAAPGLDIAALRVRGAVLASIRRLKREAVNLRELSEWPGLDRERAARLLNALYLQAGLIVSRSHPDAINENWFGGRGR